MKREILVNAGPRETRVAILEDDELVELLVDRPDARRMVGDIYLGKVDAVLPGLQAAFVDIGTDKSAFLHSSDLVYPDTGDEDEDEDGERDGSTSAGDQCGAAGSAAWLTRAEPVAGLVEPLRPTLGITIAPATRATVTRLSRCSVSQVMWWAWSHARVPLAPAAAAIAHPAHTRGMLAPNTAERVSGRARGRSAARGSSSACSPLRYK